MHHLVDDHVDQIEAQGIPVTHELIMSDRSTVILSWRDFVSPEVWANEYVAGTSDVKGHSHAWLIAINPHIKLKKFVLACRAGCDTSKARCSWYGRFRVKTRQWLSRSNGSQDTSDISGN